MKSVIKFLTFVKNYFLVAVIAILLIFIYFKNIKIENLNAKLAEAPKIEYVYNTKIDTIVLPIPKPIQVIKYKDNPKVDTLYVPIDLGASDSSKIALEYTRIYNKFAETNVYDDVLKDDTLAFIRLRENVQYNSITNRELIFLDRTPVVNITNTKYVYTTSIVGGIEAGTTGVEIGAGLITKRNNFAKISYDPFNKTTRGSVYMSIFNFKSK